VLTDTPYSVPKFSSPTTVLHPFGVNNQMREFLRSSERCNLPKAFFVVLYLWIKNVC